MSATTAVYSHGICTTGVYLNDTAVFLSRPIAPDRSTAFGPDSHLIGDVTIEAGASGLVQCRAARRLCARRRARGPNVQDGAVLHAPPGIPVDIGFGGDSGAPVCDPTASTSGLADRQPRDGASTER